MTSKILVIGATGYIGKVFVEGSVKSGRTTFALVRESSLTDPVKAKLVQSFKDLGVTILYRFLPSEFGNDVDRTVAIEPTLSEFIMKAQIRRAIEAAEIPYTYVVTGCFAGFFMPSLGQCHLRLRTPPTDKVFIYDSGDAKAIINTEEDIVAYTMKAVDDPRTLNKILYVHPPKNIVSQNDMVSLWEGKIGKTLEKTYVSEEELLKSIQEAQHPMDFVMGLIHAVLVQGDLTSFTIDPSVGVEASELYPDVKYTSVDEFLNQFV
ncbi:hypothetical protein HID58_065324 [Brassica napus]|uniref:NmrA-like domain-containing protein n=1 Tax=Brassica napus TaxID=3708 RepID=A0ABQ7XH31_BRANA|nr:hypothetical protein HID58_069253 [Brassica napus]KAH0877930.1 hypothetical protein HID58_065324 [Brassica napus]